MKTKIFLTALLAGGLLLTACGGNAEPETEPMGETEIQETVSAENPEETEAETEPEIETEPETKKQPETFTDYTRLTISDAQTPVYENGMFVVWFTEENVRYRENDACAIGISGDGEAYSVPGTIDMTAYPAFSSGDYFTGIAVKPGDVVYDGTYNVTITFAEYVITFPCTIG